MYEQIAKEVITINDLQKMYGLKYDRAAKLMREIKAHGDRLKMKGRIHKLDYYAALEFFAKTTQKIA